MVVRGICALRPGVDGFSENISVRSILGQFLEHSRIMHFRAIDEFWIGSADMMHRNLDRRVEVMAQVKDRRLTNYLEEIFDSALHPATRSWELGPDGHWTAAPRRQRGTRPSGMADGTPPAALIMVKSASRVQPAAKPMGGNLRVLAAGAVLWQPDESGDPQIALIHRPRYDDWSLPKGKLDRGETEPVAAVREIFEETGQHAVLGRRLVNIDYLIPGGSKIVHYWAARGQGGEFVPSKEVDQLQWLPIAEATRQLTYPHDRKVLRRFAKKAVDTQTVLIVRHATAGRKAHYRGDDRERPWTRRADCRRKPRCHNCWRSGPTTSTPPTGFAARRPSSHWPRS